ncbi:MAG: XTP/dITP diphosphatase [Endomicrobiaceae bacterium]|nr:XTP/dITP diphosphatase [Endomicrobiaceae bacterium]
MKIDEIILATGNKHKVLEIKDILKDLSIKIKPMTEFDNYPEVVEDGNTLEENAIKKAVEVAKFFNKWAIADDTGLEVDYLNGAPGVYSSRYAGEDCSYDDNNQKLLKALIDVPLEKRKAKFRCVIALSDPKGNIFVLSDGEINGLISQDLSGTKGFGYDPIFFVKEYNKTFAELGDGIKNEISHRALALKDFKNKLKSSL